VRKLEFTVHEFMTIMGALDERADATDGGLDDDSVYYDWRLQFQTLDKKLESLEMMDRADMLFDGKVAINFISEAHLKEVVAVAEEQVAFHQELIDSGDEDGDPEDLETWQKKVASLKTLLSSDDWRSADI
jgi:hypothetical protein